MLRAALTVLRNVVTDDSSALRLGGQGAYRIVYAVLQTHCAAEQMELVRLGSAVLWRMHHSRSPPTALLPGASSTVTASVMSEGGDAVLLPETALVFDPDRTAHVMIFAPHEDDPDVGTVVRTPVQIEIGDNGRVVMQEGPEPGTEIVATGAASSAACCTADSSAAAVVASKSIAVRAACPRTPGRCRRRAEGATASRAAAGVFFGL